MSDQVMAPAGDIVVLKGTGIRIRKIGPDAPWRWLGLAWADIGRIPAISFGYGAVFVALSYVILLMVTTLQFTSLVLPLVGAFLLVGPMLAVGLYEASRRLQANKPIEIGKIVLVATRSPVQLAFMGVLMVVLFLIWMKIAALLFALFFGLNYPNLADFIDTLLFTSEGITLLVVGTLFGAALAFVAFSMSVISVPMLMVRDMDAITAIVASFTAVRENFVPMLVWAWLIVMLIGFGAATLFVGLAITFPLVGHATWHAFKELVVDVDPD